MAIIYTYPGQALITGKELVLISDDNDEQSTRNITLQQIANLNGTNPGVSRVYFADSLGLSPSTTQAGTDPTAGIDVVEVTGTILAIGGGTGKDSAALTAANAGDILAVNSTNDGYDFIAQPTGETYTFSTQQNPTVSANVDLFIEDSQSVKDVVTLVPGNSGNVTLTADTTANPPTITIESTGGQGQTYTAGNGIAISNANVISATLANGGGLGFDNAQLTTNLTPANLSTVTNKSNGDVLTYDGNNGMNWVTPAYSPQISTISLWNLVYVDGTYSAVLHTGVGNQKGTITVSYDGPGNQTHATISWNLSFQLATASTLKTGGYHLGLAKEDGSALFPNHEGTIEFAGGLSRVTVVDQNNTIVSDQWETPVTNVAILEKPNTTTCQWEGANGFRDPANCGAADAEIQSYIWFSAMDQVNVTTKQTIYQPATAWIKNTIANSDTIYLAGSITAFGNFTFT